MTVSAEQSPASGAVSGGQAPGIPLLPGVPELSEGRNLPTEFLVPPSLWPGGGRDYEETTLSRLNWLRN